MKSTDELKNEHQGIKVMLRVLQALANKFERGEQLNIEHISGIMEFLSVFVNTCHHGKEEEFLFPALEAVGVPRDGGPIGVMLKEHEQGRKLVARLKNLVKNYLSGDKTTATSVKIILDEYVELLTQHIEKENNVLFAMADAKLDSHKDSELFEAFKRLERERIGEGKHEEFHSLLDRLQGAYLN